MVISRNSKSLKKKKKKQEGKKQTKKEEKSSSSKISLDLNVIFRSSRGSKYLEGGVGGRGAVRKCISGAYVHRDRRTIMQSVAHFKCRNANYHLWQVPPPSPILPPGNTSVQDARGYTSARWKRWMVYAGSDTALFHENSSSSSLA